MTLVTFLLILILSGYSESQWVQTNKTAFCDKVASCVSHSNNLTLPDADGLNLPLNDGQNLPLNDEQNLPLNDGQSICEHATECSNSTDSPNYFISEESEIMSNSVQTRYMVNGNESLFCSELGKCKANLNAFKYLPNMTHLCPYAHHCGLNASMTVTDDWTISCCSSCSCSSDCGKNRECCFDIHDNYNVVDAEQMTCVDMELTFGHAGFYMFDTCPNDPGCYKPSTMPEPVSSRITKRIYINMKCAQCITGFNESAFIRWQMAVAGQGFDDEMFKTCMSNRQHCTAIFNVPPLHRAWIMHFACGSNLRSSCSTRQRNENQEVADACSSTIHAPVIYNRYPTFVYRNIYCAFCEKYALMYHDPTSVCPIQLDEDVKPKGFSMSMLLDSEVFNEHQVDVCLQEDNTQEGRCHLLFCPDWMLRIDGKCVYYTKRWFNAQLIHQFVLVPSKPMAAAMFQNMTQEDRHRVNTWLFNDCNLPLDASYQFITYKVYMLPTTLGTVLIVKEFYLRMFGKYKNLEPRNFFPSIKACIDRRWRIVRDGMTYYLSASLYPYQRFMPDGKTKRPHVSQNRSVSETPLTKIYEPISINKNTFNSGSKEKYVLFLPDENTVVTKLAYCERVRLTLDEVDLMYGQIRIKMNSRVLSDAEFGVEYDKVDGDKTLAFVYVCVEDYRYNNGRGTGTSIGHSAVGITCAILVAGMIIYIREY